MGYENEDLTVKYLGKEYVVTKFKKFHPGGSNTLSAFKGLDITKQFIETEHSPAAYNLLKDYRPTDEGEKVSRIMLKTGYHIHSGLLKLCIY